MSEAEQLGGGRPVPRFEVDAVKPVTKAAQLTGVQLVSCFFIRRDDDPLPTWDGVFEDDSVTFGTSGTYELDRTSEPPNLGCYLAFTASFDSDEGTAESAEDAVPEGPFFIGATFRAHYELSSTDGLTDDAIEMFAYWNGVLTLWPYWRELASSLAQRTGVQLNVPVFRVPAT